ncbi:hypothetical protein LGH82_25675 [Mesorhizobium sp. PAMC28654]|uniref:hypothetical protein n=1 Tax=Mesorhizobium sp. PAMC28654 TaxID=2880934 RepID=UPI001D0B8028|nr:hypothetical protein [Mesorhizobium sp. PAMC28654]UDL88486.1 hypothetical protein LGH82_25675 [Mesorhizobium sp. PAMC28654]
MSTVFPLPVVVMPIALSPATVAVRGSVLVHDIGAAAPLTVIGAGDAGCVQLAANDWEESAISVEPSAVPSKSSRRRFGRSSTPPRMNATFDVG